MKKRFTEATALGLLNKESNVSVRGKTIIVKGGFSGLQKCAAYDFLKNHCGYRGVLN